MKQSQIQGPVRRKKLCPRYIAQMKRIIYEASCASPFGKEGVEGDFAD